MGERAQAEVAERAGHTPGPWTAGRSLNRGVLCVTANDGCTWICGELLNEHEPISGTEAQANARLIAAAPEMLAVLKKIIAATYLDQAGCACTFDEFWRVGANEIKSAIAKAEGR